MQTTPWIWMNGELVAWQSAVAIVSWPWGPYLGAESQTNGIRAKISSWQRVGPNVIPHAAKATGIYVNSMLAVNEARDAGHDEAILLTGDGFVADGSGENVFAVCDGVISTPSLSASILPGITRDTVIAIARPLADEVFMSGTAAEVTPLRAVDGVELGVGPVTESIRDEYLCCVRGLSSYEPEWLERVTLELAA
jgi:branched-chain amino acid aminotransferase